MPLRIFLTREKERKNYLEELTVQERLSSIQLLFRNQDFVQNPDKRTAIKLKMLCYLKLVFSSNHIGYY